MKIQTSKKFIAIEKMLNSSVEYYSTTSMVEPKTFDTTDFTESAAEEIVTEKFFST